MADNDRGGRALAGDGRARRAEPAAATATARRGGGGARRSTDDDDDDDDDDDATEETGATFRATVAPVGHGFFIDGSVDAVIAVACEVCGAPTMQRVEGVDVKAWLDENANELDSSGETEVIPFPRHREECDPDGVDTRRRAR